MPDGKKTQALWDEYLQAKDQLSEIENEFFPIIEEICEACNLLGSRDFITDINFSDEPTWLDEPEITVHVNNYSCGPDTYHFPKRYINMSIDEIKADVEETKRKTQEDEKRKALDKERREYERLKKKFEG